MKIPFLQLHIVKTQLLTDKQKSEEILEAMRWITSDCLPELEQIKIVLHGAKVGRESYGRRKAGREVMREVSKLKAKIRGQNR